MTPSDDDLIGQYVRDGSNPAFSELVRRYLSMVYSAAHRQVGSAALAEDIAQSVFLDLSKHASKLKPGQPLAAWLHLVTRRTAIDVIRRESRRRLREKTASEIAAMKSDSSLWHQMEPLLDAALEDLSEVDRNALLQRYFANKSLREVGETLGTSEDAAQKRVGRAIDQLRIVFARRGIIVTSAGLVTDLSAHAILPAPASLGVAISASAISAAVIPSAALLKTASTITMTLLNKTLIATAFILTGGLLYEGHLLAKREDELQALRRKSDDLRAQMRVVDGERNRNGEKLALSLQQLEAARAQILRFQTGKDPAMESELESWLTRVDRLKARLAQMPDKNIPEMKFLTSNDWLAVTLDNRLETDADVRKALSRLRNLAKTKPQVSSNLEKALRSYMKANDNQPPSAPSQLRPYLDPLLSDDILARYELSMADPPGAPHVVGRLMQEKSPVDEDYDTLLFFMKGGYGFQGVSKFGDAVRQAVQAFAKANNGQTPVAVEQIFPYLPAQVDQTKLKEYWQAIQGGQN
jgi:RNA polymerase sigma factor (sigma-70 family)